MEERILAVLEVLREDLPPSLIGGEGYDRMAAVAAMLPSDLSTFWGFEYRLGEAEAVADILFETRVHSWGQRLLAGLLPSSLDPLCVRSETWRTLRHLAGLWADPDHPFNTQIQNVWLEFDAGTAATPQEASEGVTTPSFFFGPAQNQRSTMEALRTLILDVLAALGRPEAEQGIVPPFFDSLPSKVQPFQIGLMFSRPGSGLRMVVDGLTPGDAGGWLERLKWEGEPQTVAAVMEELTPVVRSMALGLDVGVEGAFGKIGIECYMERTTHHEPVQWVPLLNLLQERGLCLPSKREGLLAFPGISRSPLDGRVSRHGIVFTHAHRSIHHIKLSLLRDRIVEAKAYTAVHRPGVRMAEMLAGGRSSLSGERRGLRDPWLLE